MMSRYSIKGFNPLKHSFVLLLCVSIAGCASTTNMAPEQTELRDDEAIVILGVRPKFQIQIWNGRDVGADGWSLPLFQRGVLNHAPEDGYIIFKLPATKPGQSYGLGRFLDAAVDGTVFELCEDSFTPTFKLQAGSVVYAGDLVFSVRGSSASFRLVENPAAAREHIRENYPDLAPQLVSVPASARRVTNADCSSISVTIPIMVL